MYTTGSYIQFPVIQHDGKWYIKKKPLQVHPVISELKKRGHTSISSKMEKTHFSLLLPISTSKTAGCCMENKHKTMRGKEKKSDWSGTRNSRNSIFMNFISHFSTVPIAYGRLKPRDQIGTSDTDLCHSHSNTRSKSCP